MFKETGDTKYIYKSELDKACFQHDMAYGDFKDLAKRTASDNVSRDKTFNIAKNPKYDGYQRDLASMIDKKNQQLVVLKMNYTKSVIIWRIKQANYQKI